MEEGQSSPEVCALWGKGEAHGVLGTEGSTQEKNSPVYGVWQQQVMITGGGDWGG